MIFHSVAVFFYDIGVMVHSETCWKLFAKCQQVSDLVCHFMTWLPWFVTSEATYLQGRDEIKVANK